MSNTNNTNFLEQKYDTFKWACEVEDWELAKTLIDEVADKGFISDAVDMSLELLTAKMSVNEI